MNNQRGQSLLEYVFLLAVIAAITVSVFRSSFFKNLFGNDSEAFASMKTRMEFTYKHGFESGQYPKEPLENYSDYSENTHPSYSQLSGGDTRIFLSTRPYGE